MSILWNFDKYAKIEELPFDPQCINSDNLFPISDHELLLKAGTPLVLSGGEETGYTTGTVHPYFLTETPTCFAAEDYHFILTNAQQPKLVKCVTKGYVEQAKVLAAAGLESAPDGWADALAALGLFLVDDLGNLPGGSGGVLVVRISPAGSGKKAMDKTWQEIADSDFAVCYTTPPLGGKYFMYITRATAFESDYEVTVVVWDNNSAAFVSNVFTTDSPDGYPSIGSA